MTLPAKAVYDILMGSPEIANMMNRDMIFMIDVPEDDQQVLNAPIIRINEINDYQDGFASNKPFSVSFSVQIDVWAATIEQLAVFRDVLDKIMTENEWGQYTGVIDKDPDIDLYRMARRYRAVQVIHFN
ncbi:hypothetical protein QQ991_10685 [Weizmannia coagulans]|jgi:hypothetical protein|uniref:DUF3168 domain-containing protein n=2 Tax=Heyndrickxia TaxID=2837504 RepID=A0AAN0T795_HEYCO|nr:MULTISPECIES: hypothetical protein [Heyndrickxia]NWN93801.1 hypothetical protein [Bacillus sp. (in: firmicutes)]AJO22885.1 hypothetical protein SB48_HM08orf03310 [Heyndrickxia coagulans]AKN55604.1 hypothetical protein AB434_3199 [Heyndrickxia coagulans]ATW83124.1 hypothetical protein CIW84_09095 [Heyndrickxia coagulans]KGB28330.1 hypothetical protein IE89_17245 [Heyndrickxia coagulans]